ncbi:MAG: NuoM family protein [Planctomyces sp.]
MFLLLILCLAIPTISAILLMLFRSSLNAQTSRWLALVGSTLALAVSMMLLSQYKEASAAKTAQQTDGAARAALEPLVSHRHSWMMISGTAEKPGVQLELYMGLDGISVAMIALTCLLTVSSVLISWESIRERASEFYACLLILETGLIGVFCSFDLMLFYVFFEMTLIPLFFLIAIWGGPDRRWAAFKFFLYTLAGSLVTLSGLVVLVLLVSRDGLLTPTSLPALASWLAQHPLPASTQTAFFLTLSAGFLIKVPVFPFHTWLPLAHVEAPTAGSVMLAGVLLKLGSYGFLRMCLPMFPEACVTVGIPLIGLLSFIGIIYWSFCALAQRDIKKLVAYSSVAHMGFCILGLFALNTEGITGSVVQMVNHGLSTGALFLLVGMVYERYHTRMLDDIGGLATRLPLIACSMVFIAMSSIGLPGLNGFVGEFLSLAGMFRRNPLYSALGTTGVILGAWYLLTAVQHGFFGALREPHGGHHHEDHEVITDLKPRELLSLAPLAVMCLWLGVKPAILIDLIEPDVRSVVAIYEKQSATAAVTTPDSASSVKYSLIDR